MQRCFRLSCGLAAALVAVALAGGPATSARADVAYAFAEQTISGIAITPVGSITAASVTTTLSQDNATLNGSGQAASNPIDAPQTFLGGSPPAPQNFFTRYAPGNPPISPTTPQSFTRGDSLILGTTVQNNGAAVVAESYLNNASPPGTNSETGGAGTSATFSFTVGANATALTIAYNYANDLVVYGTGLGAATANYHFNITIKDAAGNVVFSSSTPNTNLSLTGPPPAFTEVGPRSGSETVTTPTLTAGATYTMILSNTAQSAVTVAAVPEPGAVTLVAVSGVVALGVGAVRRRALRRAPK